jgi:hypothetical protein
MEGDFKSFEENMYNSIKQAEETSIEVLKNNLTQPTQVQKIYAQNNFSPFYTAIPLK